ncbi:MAG: molybdenum ABC transporter ATP-binding protein [Sedimenticola sp.]|jgi:molybdate transport system ATP-binding protein|nr:MAG: molybdenum ABC transporter ATP-binding protein [Sedimenticola sp.]
MSADGISARFHLTYPGFTLDVDLELPGRGVIALFGHSGSGKTTLLRCIAGLARAETGRLRVHGELWQDDTRFLPTHKRPLGYVFQEASLFPHLSARGNLQYAMKRAVTAVDVERFDQAVELLGIGPLLDRRPDQLSGGERQRVAIARALLINPRLLLMDEPLAALDLARKQEILPYLERLRTELDVPVLYVSHSPDEVAHLADYIVAMNEGQVVAHGPLAETLARLDFPIRLGEDTGVVLDARVVELDPVWKLARVAFDGGELWLRDGGHPVGQSVRLRILARDISLALNRHDDSSILNLLPGRVAEIAADDNKGSALVRVDVGASALVARVTLRSVSHLELEPGKPVWAQIKSVALIQ